MPKFEVQSSKGSNHRTFSYSGRTGLEPSDKLKSLKALAQRVISRSSTSNLPSNSHRTKEFEPSNFEPQNSPSKFEDKNGSISHRESLVATASRSVSNPAAPCPACGSGQWWQLPGNPWHCRACEPDMHLEATTLTLPCHEPRSPCVHHSERLHRMLEAACHRLTVTPEELCEELKTNGDLADLESGTVSVKALRQVAMTLGAMRAQESASH